MSLTRVAVLFARSDSCYHEDPRCDVYDIERDAKSWPRGSPIVAHPPCRAWGKYKWKAQPRPGEKELALLAISMIRNDGGVLEHPLGSGLWAAAGLPAVGKRDAFGGFTLAVEQHWWGHRALKPTLLYVCGIEPDQVPPMPPKPATPPTHVITGTAGLRKGHPDWRPECSKAEREATPPAFAKWLVDLASRCTTPKLTAEMEAECH